MIYRRISNLDPSKYYASWWSSGCRHSGKVKHLIFLNAYINPQINRALLIAASSPLVAGLFKQYYLSLQNNEVTLTSAYSNYFRKQNFNSSAYSSFTLSEYGDSSLPFFIHILYFTSFSLHDPVRNLILTGRGILSIPPITFTTDGIICLRLFLKREPIKR